MGPVEQQMALHAEALRRAASRNGGDPRPENLEDASHAAGLQIGDMWSSNGQMPGTMHPDLQGPGRAMTFEDVTRIGPTTANFEDIVANPHHPRREMAEAYLATRISPHLA